MTIGLSDQLAALQVRKVYDSATNNEPIQCPECARNGLTQFLRFHHISLHEAVQKCAQSTCMYPFRGFRYRSTSDPQQRVYRLERIAPPTASSTTCGAPTESIGPIIRHDKVVDEDDATTATPAVLDVTEHQDDAAVYVGGNVQPSPPSMATAASELSALVTSSENLPVDGDDPFNMLWLDEIAAQACGDGADPERQENTHGVSQLFEDFSLDESGMMMDKCLTLANDSIMDQLDIDEILDDICNSAPGTEELVDSDAMEQTLHELSTAIVDQKNVERSFVESPPFYPATSKGYLKRPKGTAPPSPASVSSGPPRLTKCFAQFASPKQRKPARKPRKTIKTSFNFNFVNQPKVEPLQSDEDSVAASSSTRSTSPTDSITSTSSSTSGREKRASDAAEKLQHIIALKNKLAPLDLINSLGKLDFSALNLSTSTQSSKAPSAPKPRRVVTSRKTGLPSAPKPKREIPSSKSVFKLNFLNDCVEPKLEPVDTTDEAISFPPAAQASPVISTNSIDADPDFFGFGEQRNAEGGATKMRQPDFLGFTRRDVRTGRGKIRALHQILTDKRRMCTKR